MQGRTVFKAERVVTPFRSIERGAVLVEGGRIVWVGPQVMLPPQPDAQVVDAGARTLTPGFVDIHVHGSGGHAAGASADATAGMLVQLVRHGATSVLPTLGGDEDFEELLRELDVVRAFVGTDTPGSDVLGVHLEGPYLSAEGAARGSQIVEAMRRPSVSEVERMWDASGGTLRYMTLAPEIPGAMEVIDALVERGIVPSAGHTNASYEVMDAAIRRGLRSVCHTFNGMPPMHHRNPGVVGAALTRPELNAELIGDGYHVNPVAMQVLMNCKAPDGITLITDNTHWAGMPDGRYPHGPHTVIKEGDRCWVEGGTLSGSVMPMNRIVRAVVETTGCRLEDAVQMAAFNPARLMGVADRKGSLEPGKDADMIALGPHLEVDMAVVRGRIVFQNL
ncbi:N-acetylglucosamine-6-phosphate deacetylase [Limnochorda pilosa]|uniref:N-acetylglucosamine-6-phosphate deacetylase n=1 Tax=Limnochorda pilosa TaxID=1555112 RepID=A0A0K2SLB3_LIMPI|nr:N-acetylglucosamine-6-phosphate deacetylase [Limnochorda pilosa]BAS27911.1 N-acetylglucosamine-6-phosphate deacetylase [Limnochorda pilosa]